MYWGGLFLGKKLLSVLNKRKCVDYLENKKNMFSWTACAHADKHKNSHGQKMLQHGSIFISTCTSRSTV